MFSHGLLAAVRKFLIVFPTSYLVGSGFSAATNLLTKKGNAATIVKCEEDVVDKYRAQCKQIGSTTPD